MSGCCCAHTCSIDIAASIHNQTFEITWHLQSRDTHVASPASSPKASEVEGSSPTGPLSFCSSLSSSMGSDSPDRLHDICNYTTQVNCSQNGKNACSG